MEKYGQQALLSKKNWLSLIHKCLWNLNGPYVKKKSLISRVFFALLEKLGFKSILKEQELAVETSYEIVKTPAELAAYLESGGRGI